MNSTGDEKMSFTDNEIINKNSDLSWVHLLEEVRKLEEKGPQECKKNQWIFRAIGKWNDKEELRIESSFDEAWGRREKIESSDKEIKLKRRLYESWILLDFKREAQNYLDNLPDKDNFLEWMALGRHYGMPSRLVDFSYSFFVAAYFALSMREKGQDGRILAVNLDWLKKNWEAKIDEKRSGDWSAKLKEARIAEVQASFHNKELFRRFAFAWGADYVVAVNPLRRNPRLARQQGLFLCPSNIGKNFGKNLANTLNSGIDNKRLIRLHSLLKTDAIKALHGMGISLASLYPDLVGWAESRRDIVHFEIPDERFERELENALDDPRI